MTLYPRSHIRVGKRSHVSPAPTISQPAAASQEASPSQPSHSSDKKSQGIELSTGLCEISQWPVAREGPYYISNFLFAVLPDLEYQCFE